MVGIYKITSPTNKVYVGQSWNIDFRFSQYASVCVVKSQRYIYNSLVKYGVDKHLFEVVLELRDDISQETLDCWEEYFYDLYKNQGYELLNLALPGNRRRLTEETKKKIGDAHRGRKLDKEWIENIRKANLGKKLSPEHLLKMQEGLKEYYQHNKGYWADKELTTEQKQIFAKNLKSGAERSTSKIVLQYDRQGNFIKEWSYLREITKMLGIPNSNISECCHNRRKSAGGFIWKFKEKEVLCQ